MYPAERQGHCQCPKFMSGKGRYEVVARMDADGVAAENRIEELYSYLRANDLDIVGSNYDLIDAKGTFIRTVAYAGYSGSSASALVALSLFRPSVDSL